MTSPLAIKSLIYLKEDYNNSQNKNGFKANKIKERTYVFIVEIGLTVLSSSVFFF